MFKSGTTAKNKAYTGFRGEITYDTDLNIRYVHDGITPGGFRMPTLDDIALLTSKLNLAITTSTETVTDTGKQSSTAIRLSDGTQFIRGYIDTRGFSGAFTINFPPNSPFMNEKYTATFTVSDAGEDITMTTVKGVLNGKKINSIKCVASYYGSGEAGSAPKWLGAKIDFIILGRWK